MRRLPVRVGLVAVLASLAACSDPSGPPKSTPTTITAASDNPSVAPTGASVPVVPGVLIRDQSGNPVAGVQVTFTAGANSGTVTPTTATTSSAGIARPTQWVLSANAGTQTLTATAGSLSTTLTVTAVDMHLDKFAGDATTCPVSSTGCRFAVFVRTAAGAPLSGQTVIWSRPGASPVNTTSNARGYASSPNLDPTGVAGATTQTAQLQASGAQVTFTYSHVTSGGYNLEIRFIGTPSATQQAAFTAAKQRWEQVITGNLQQVALNTPAGTCTPVNHPAINETIDDLVVFVEIVPIDGVGQALAQAGPCFIRSSSRIPVVGFVKLDAADLSVIEANGLLSDVVLHELGHAIGLPYLWCAESPSDQTCLYNYFQGKGGADPFFTGPRGSSAFVLAGSTVLNRVPIENTGGVGARDAHWRESVLGTELMTGFISGTSNPLSTTTIGALMDGGYQVNFGAASSYALPGTAFVAEPWAYAANRLEMKELPAPAPRLVD